MCPGCDLPVVRSGTRHEGTGLIDANGRVLGLSAQSTSRLGISPPSTSRSWSARIIVGPTTVEDDWSVRGESAFGGSAA